jgi:hypothetical protein
VNLSISALVDFRIEPPARAGITEHRLHLKIPILRATQPGPDLLVIPMDDSILRDLNEKLAICDL